MIRTKSKETKVSRPRTPRPNLLRRKKVFRCCSSLARWCRLSPCRSAWQHAFSVCSLRYRVYVVTRASPNRNDVSAQLMLSLIMGLSDGGYESGVQATTHAAITTNLKDEMTLKSLHFDRYRGVRVGEASTPGPPRLHDQQERALDALARVGIGPTHNGGVTHVASESFFDCEQPDNLVRSADDQSDHTAPGMTPPPSEDDTPGAADRQAVCEATLLDTPPETARSFGLEAVAFLRQLAKARARESPARLRPAVQRASVHRWTGMLAVAAQRALAYSLLELPLAAADECDGTEPPLGDLLADARDTEPVPASRLPAPC
ncbi:hypothetical protein AK812_SmicGene10351 [Symbiodinium microadriaticum]|uniref:Uncharacterized protein n=1 Tax=Symbiodinium microadriaticum TaxID=2951 RepID=A0A1Q9EFW7_SYMMI|nr:hypothetical protein AK812_SmicGene10351 [Symbiodinium microadriaticum]